MRPVSDALSANPCQGKEIQVAEHASGCDRASIEIPRQLFEPAALHIIKAGIDLFHMTTRPVVPALVFRPHGVFVTMQKSGVEDRISQCLQRQDREAAAFRIEALARYADRIDIGRDDAAVEQRGVVIERAQGTLPLELCLTMT